MRWRDNFDLPKQLGARVPPLVTELLVALVATIASAGARFILNLFFTNLASFPLSFPAVVLATLVAGPRSGVFVIGFYQLFVYFVLPAPKYSFFTGNMSDIVSLILIITAQLLLLWFVAIYRSIAEKTAELERQRAIELGTTRSTLARQRELEQELRAQNLALHETQQYLQTIYDATSEGVTLCRAVRSDEGKVVDYQVIEVNRAHQELTGAARDRMLALPVGQIAPPVDPRWFESADTALKTGTMQQFDVYSRATRRWLNIRVSPISGDLFQQTFIDVSDRHLLDEQRQSLLKEMSHRVLNNFQMIASFLHLQSADAKPEVKQQLDIAKNRIQVIAKLHSLLAYSTTETDVDVGSYLKELCGQLSQTIDRPAAIQLKCECPPSRLHPDSVVPLGLITSELVMNAIKYAFPVPREGTITVRFNPNGPDSWILEIEDDGIGLPLRPDGEPAMASRGGLGMRLVQIFVRQLKGQLVTTSGPGVRHRLSFKA